MQYQEIRSEYRALVIEDPEVKDVERWKRVEDKLVLYLSSSKEDRIGTPKALYLLARLYEQKAKILRDTTDQERAIQNFTTLVDTFPQDDLADDALLALARISHRNEKLVQAKSYLEKIISDYGASDSIQHAQTHYTEVEQAILIRNTKHQSNIEQTTPQKLSNEPVLIASLEERMPLVVVDAGHGGSEDGAIGPGGIKEKDITLAIAFILRDLLKETGMVRVHMTRTGDETLKLSDRTSIANEVKGDLFVSIHANASEYKTSKGVETYYLDNTDDKSSLRLAERENFTPQGPQNTSLSFIVSDFIQGIKMDDSISLAHLIQDNLVERVRKENPHIKNLGVKKAPFYVLVGAHMPCVLTEVSFIDHPQEGRLLGTLAYQKLVAQGIFDGVMAFLKKKSKL